MTGGPGPRRLEIKDMLRKAIVVLMLAGFATVAAAEIVYKWVDTRGQIHYSDLPPNEAGAKLLGTYQRDLLPESMDQADDTTSAGTQPDSSPPGEEPSAATAAAVQRDVAQVRAEQCKKAQAQYKTYVESRRLYRQTADGKREYLTDAELTAARLQAKQDMDELCK
jgi:hypothetical protein